ncbi:cytochrome c oxidase assembly protein [Egibacter rhizosphaerae]|uniref:cytochrome c oxidase assembly protein n=1 Tax=Egibacter rhizosphaerae TaxID=1670831 RepID=UPI0013F1626B|nr:cytochrome c oxidase assembly protein [Egibacter rhizosphaerae]
MDFWCSATYEPWSWTPRPYLGAWLLSAALLAWYFLARARLAPPRDGAPSRRQIASFVGGVVALHLATDWPIAALGGGYLASAHVVQFILISFVAMPLLLAGVPAWLARRVLRSGGIAVARWLARPLPALAIFNGTLLATHSPLLLDPSLESQVAKLVIDLAWILAAIVLWMPVLSPLPEVPRLSPPAQMAYLFGQSVLPTIPASFLTFAAFPLYEVYELAPPVHGFDATMDQRFAGLAMKVVAGLLLWVRIARIWFRWSASEEADPPPPTAGTADEVASRPL